MGSNPVSRFIQGASLNCLLGVSAVAQTFHLPTANRALFEPGGEERFFVGTVGRPWTSGAFGCTRSGGYQFHEGLDIRCLERDKKGEPTDAVMATADGTVAYVNAKPGLSTFGNYVIIRHRVEGIEIYSTYAHLRSAAEGLRAGQDVRAGEVIGIMGRTASTREGISKERAHVHFELNLLTNDRFPAWHKEHFPGERNDHGKWNGRNLVGIDPQQVLMLQHAGSNTFSILNFLRNQNELFRVFVRDTEFPWLLRYRPLIKRNPVAEREGIVGYEISFTFSGVAFKLMPRAASEMPGNGRYQILTVNELEHEQNPCGKLITRKTGLWELTPRALNLLDLLTY